MNFLIKSWENSIVLHKNKRDFGLYFFTLCICWQCYRLGIIYGNSMIVIKKKIHRFVFLCTCETNYRSDSSLLHNFFKILNEQKSLPVKRVLTTVPSRIPFPSQKPPSYLVLPLLGSLLPLWSFPFWGVSFLSGPFSFEEPQSCLILPPS